MGVVTDPPVQKVCLWHPHLLVICDVGLKVSVVFSDLLAQGAQGLGIVLVHLLLPFLVFPQLKDSRRRKNRECETSGLATATSPATCIPSVLSNCI